MDLEKYQDRTTDFWVGYREQRADWDDTDNELNYCLTALGGETGEALNDWKKYIAKRYTKEEIRAKLLDELGDVLYYLVRSARALDLTLEDVADFNIQKLAERHEHRIPSRTNL